VGRRWGAQGEVLVRCAICWRTIQDFRSEFQIRSPPHNGLSELMNRAPEKWRDEQEPSLRRRKNGAVLPLFRDCR